MTLETYGLQCRACGELWDAFNVPCSLDVALRAMKTNRSCIRCKRREVVIVMPWRYRELLAERRPRIVS